MSDAAIIAQLRRKNEQLEDRIAVLEDALGWNIPAPFAFNLTPSEGRVFGMLMSREIISRDGVMTALYSHRPADSEVPDIKIVDVFVCKMRKKLRTHGINVHGRWGVGYFLPAADKDKVRAMNAPAEPRPRPLQVQRRAA